MYTHLTKEPVDSIFARIEGVRLLRISIIQSLIEGNLWVESTDSVTLCGSDMWLFHRSRPSCHVDQILSDFFRCSAQFGAMAHSLNKDKSLSIVFQIKTKTERENP